METPKDRVDLGSQIGRHQAFAVIANRSTASQALALRPGTVSPDRGVGLRARAPTPHKAASSSASSSI
jgi:hypothetical protein